MPSSESILTGGKTFVQSGVPALRAVAAPGVLGPVPPVGRSERLLPPVAWVVVVVRSVTPLRPDCLADPVADWRS